MADLFEDRLSRSYQSLREKYAERVDVPADRRFVGFDAYQKAMACLRPGDVVLCTTHAAFRGLHVEHAVAKGLHVFMEKTFAPDPGGIQRILRAGEAAEKKGLKIGAGRDVPAFVRPAGAEQYAERSTCRTGVMKSNAPKALRKFKLFRSQVIPCEKFIATFALAASFAFAGAAALRYVFQPSSMIAGTELKPGQYKVQVDGSKMTIKQDNKRYLGLGQVGAGAM